ncbi:MAG: hypothetical protein MRERV_5c041 [Mycoplasmataceae bacterium RV_VA103A]|nr:MAG: hypothetical protein MRERV_5c041 [Mycoplasmataceae bacterium RV_VA103A]
MSENKNNKKALAEKLRNHLNAPEYVAVPDLIRRDDYDSGLSCYDGENILQKRKFIDWEKQSVLINYDDLEPTDWKEIINLIKQRNEEREKNYQAKKKKIEEEVNSQPGLYYYYGSGSKDDRSNSIIDYGDKQGRYFGLWGSENGRSFYLNINAKHPVLDTFPYGKHGYYLIETDKPIERNDGVVRPWSSGGENNPSNFHKWVEVGDKITITPYEVANGNELSENQKKELEAETARKGNCDTCQKKLKETRFIEGDDNSYIIKRYHGKANIGGPAIWACQGCYSTKEQEYLQNYAAIYETFRDENGGTGYRLIKAEWIDCYAGKKDQNGQILKQRDCSHCQPWKQHEISNPSKIFNPNNDEEIKQIATFLLRYFQEHDIKKIELDNDQLIITHNNNNNEIVSRAGINHELQNVENYLTKRGENTLELQQLLNELNSSSNPTSDSPKKDYTPYLIGGAIGVGLATLTAIGFYLRKSKKNKEKKNR